jgi:hypothetical protein
MHQGYGYGNMPMPVPGYGAQTGPGVAPTRPPYNVNSSNPSSRSQTDSVMSQLSTQLDQADQSELQELHDQEEKLHQLLNENNEVYFALSTVRWNRSMTSSGIGLYKALV